MYSNTNTKFHKYLLWQNFNEFIEHLYLHMDKLCLRSYIKTRWLLGLTATQIYNELTTAYIQDVVSYRTVARWVERFSNEREGLEDDPRSGRPITAVTQQNIDDVDALVNDGPLLIHELPSGTSINAIYYRDECLKTLVKNLQKKRPLSTTNGIKLHHDNARPHTSNIIFDYLQQQKINVMAHPPYSPDLAPSDFWLFDYLKRDLNNYPDDTSLAKAITATLKSTPIHEYQKTFHKWIERMKLCIEHHGDYFEQLL